MTKIDVEIENLKMLSTSSNGAFKMLSEKSKISLKLRNKSSMRLSRKSGGLP